MANKNSSKGKQNLRQRKKPQPAENDEPGPAKENATSKQNLPMVLAALAMVLLIVGLASISSPEEEVPVKRKDVKQKPERNKQRRQLDEKQQTPIITQMVSDYKVLKTLPHDPKAFTQGLTFPPNNSSIVYESTGMYNESDVRVLDLQTGDVLQQYQLAGHLFGEGLSYFETSNGVGRLILITWKEQAGFIFDIGTLEVVEEFNYTTTTDEGWGVIQSAPDEFIVSDGSAFLNFWNLQYQDSKPKIEVKYHTQEMIDRGLEPQSLRYLNELEWDPVTKTVLANVWFQDMIVRIDPTTGFVTTMYDLRPLYTDRLPGADVFNGIALSSSGDLWVTGKYWPFLYQIQLGKEL